MEERKKILHSVTGESLREIVNFIKEREIAKEDLWMIDKDKGQYTLLYFKYNSLGEYGRDYDA